MITGTITPIPLTITPIPLTLTPIPLTIIQNRSSYRWSGFDVKMCTRVQTAAISRSGIPPTTCSGYECWVRGFTAGGTPCPGNTERRLLGQRAVDGGDTLRGVFRSRRARAPPPTPRRMNVVNPPTDRGGSALHRKREGGGSLKFRLPRKNPRHPVTRMPPLHRHNHQSCQHHPLFTSHRHSH